MEQTHKDPEAKPTWLNEPEFDLYTIPSYASWFAWDNIHDIERTALKEFFDGTSITRTPKIYKEYRDFIINKYREDPSRKLTFTGVRKYLVGDVSLLNKVFKFLDNYGLINFSADNNDSKSQYVEEKKEISNNVRVEDGPPTGIRVVAMPNSLKPISLPSKHEETVLENPMKLLPPPLSSHSDVFATKIKLVCGNCGDNCSSCGRYEYNKGDYNLCTKCFEKGSYGENKSKDDFKFNESIDERSTVSGVVWSEAETLRLLESVLKHEDNWDLIVHDVQTKSKLDCISKLIELPFGDVMLSFNIRNGSSIGLNTSVNNSKQVPVSAKQDEVENHKGALDGQNKDSEKAEDDADEGSPLKRKCIASLSDAGGSLMKQVARISTVVGPAVAAAAAEAAFAALCDETSCPREIFGKEDFPSKGLWSPPVLSKSERNEQVEDTAMKETPTHAETEETSLGQEDIPLNLRLKTAVGTALGAAAAHAKLLADKEDKEIENLVSTIIETQYKKLQCKMKNLDALEVIMEKERAELEERKESLIEERINVVQKAIAAGLSKWRDHVFAKP